MSSSPMPRPTIGSFVGWHVLAEAHGVDPALLDDPDFLSNTLEVSLKEAGATVCEMNSLRFEPQGVTVLAMLAESHASMHTYPELGALFVDVFTCGESANPEHAVRQLTSMLGATGTRTSTVRRGHRAPVLTSTREVLQ
ncbi:MAG: adenosylmethionine decarboxylase [Pseudonocardiaceae bacterium]|nr:adenosylmethionine decarboxylase [Pseudonocardiaceae bacterium]